MDGMQLFIIGSILFLVGVMVLFCTTHNHPEMWLISSLLLLAVYGGFSIGIVMPIIQEEYKTIEETQRVWYDDHLHNTILNKTNNLSISEQILIVERICSIQSSENIYNNICLEKAYADILGVSKEKV